MDPWDWGVDDVVANLCQSTALWADRPNSKLPAADVFEAALRDNEIDGSCLLTDITLATLKDDLGIKPLGQRSSVIYAIEKLRHESFRWKTQEVNSHKRQQQISALASVASPEPTPPHQHSQLPTAPIQQVPPSPWQTPAKRKLDEAEHEPSDGRTKRKKLVPQLIQAIQPNQRIPESRSAYLGRAKLTASDVIFGSAQAGTPPHPDLDSDDSDLELTIFNDRSPAKPGRNAFVNRRVRYLLKAEPEPLAPGHMKVMPYPENMHTGRMPALSVKMIAPGTASATKQDALLMHHASLGFSDTALTEDVGNNNEWDYLLQNHPVADQNDEALPVYGQSDDDTLSQGLDDELRKDEEENAQQPTSSRYLSLDDVHSTIEKSVAAYQKVWNTRKLPALESRAYRIWLNKGRSRLMSIDVGQLELQKKKKLLSTLEARILEEQWTKYRHVERQCASMQLTVEAIEELKWKIRLWQNSQAPPKQKIVSRVRKERKVDSDNDSIDLSSDEDDLASFIDNDEAPTGDITSKFYDYNGKKSAVGLLKDHQAPAAAPEDVDSILGNGSIQGEEDSLPDRSSSRARSKDGILNTGSDHDNFEHELVPSLIPEDADVIDLTQLQSSEAEFSHDEVQADEQQDRKQLTPEAVPVSPDTPDKPLKQERTPGQSSSQMPVWSSQPLLASREEIENNWELDDLVERKDRKRMILKLLVLMDIVQLAHLKEVFKSIDTQGFKNEFRRALGAFKFDHSQLAPYLPNAFIGLIVMARLFVCWIHCDPSHFQVAVADRQKVDKALRTEKDIPHFRAFLRGALSEDGPIAEEKEMEDTPRKRKQRKIIRSGQSLRELAFQRKSAGQQAERKLKVQSSDLSEVDYEGHVINPTDDAKDFICIRKSISDNMKDHQVEGVRFLWREAVIGAWDGPSGCLLAHTMGLGKTMQSITFLVTVADAILNPHHIKQIPKQLQPPDGAIFPRFLVLCPPSLIQNWYDEINKWIPDHQLVEYTHMIASNTEFSERFLLVKFWFDHGGLMIMGYEMLRNLLRSYEKVKRHLDAESHDQLIRMLTAGSNIIIADEAHKFKDPTTEIGKTMARLNPYCRIALTGSPLANSLSEYFAMIDWVSKGYLGTSSEFKYDFQTPIEDGTYADSTRQEQRRSYKKLEALKEEVDPKVNRKDITAVRGDLKPKTEFVLRFALTPLQHEAYSAFTRSLMSMSENSEIVSSTRMFDWLSVLTLLLYHPAVFLKKLSDRDAHRRETQKEKPGKKATPPEDAAPDVDVDLSQMNLSSTMLEQQEQTFSGLPRDYKQDTALSPKTQFIKQIVLEAKAAKEQVLIFTHSRPVLDHMQQWLRDWNKDIRISRLDGSTSVNDRTALAKDFNSGKYDLMLISTRAGGLGLNLHGASRVILNDFGFNPSWEEQAVGRAYRLGQQKPVFVYHLLCGGTFEEPLHQRTVFKKQLSHRAVDKKNSKPVANKMHEFLFVPHSQEQEDLEASKGIDTALDHVLDSEQDFRIRSIQTTDIFHQADTELTKEEMQEVKRELEMWRAKQAGDQTKVEELKKAQHNELLRQQYEMLGYPQNAPGVMATPGAGPRTATSAALPASATTQAAPMNATASGTEAAPTGVVAPTAMMTPAAPAKAAPSETEVAQSGTMAPTAVMTPAVASQIATSGEEAAPTRENTAPTGAMAPTAIKTPPAATDPTSHVTETTTPGRQTATVDLTADDEAPTATVAGNEDDQSGLRNQSVTPPLKRVT